MVEINKREAEYLRKVIPNVHITRTVHHWYAEEIKSVLLSCLAMLRLKKRYKN